MVQEMLAFWTLTLLSLLATNTQSLRYDPEQVDFNLNQNKTASDPLDYGGEWPNHTYYPSPDNWRMPFYSFFLDRFVNGDPSNDDANGTAWEHDLMGTQLRHGGDVKGLQDTLDYIAGMGIKGIYVAGSPHVNVPWASDSYSPLDLTLLDRHFGNIEAWREAISAIHSRGMYVILDNTMATMGDLIGFEGYLNTSTPFEYREHNALWKSSRRYGDFDFGNSYIDKCSYPRFWGDDGIEVVNNGTEDLIGCRDSDFDQYGEIAAFGQYPEWQRQISKFAFVQDRLREWKPDVRERIQHFSCITIAMLDIDGFRMDKGLQISVDAQGEWADYIRQCAALYGKKNFYIPGEIVGGNAFGAVYIGRGKEPSMAVENLTAVAAMTVNSSDDTLLIRDLGKNALDGAAFHYSIYRSLARFLGMDGEIAAGYDVPVNFVQAWQGIMRTNDMINAMTGLFDPRHMYGVTNQDVFRWPGIVNGTLKQNLGTFITTLLLPGVPLLSWGEEQAFYVLDNTASNYVFGRQSMSSAQAWQIHGCYKVGDQKFANWPVESSLTGCQDNSVSLDHRDPSHPIRNIMKIMFELRSRFPVLNDGFYLQQLSNQTRDIYLPGSSIGQARAPTETGLFSILRSRVFGVQDFTNIGQGNQSVWLVYHNDNVTKTYTFDCSNSTSALIAPFDSNITVKNLFWPFEEYYLESSTQKLGLENSYEFNGCLSTMNMTAYGFKAFVPVNMYMEPSPAITKFLPGHDQRLLSNVTRFEQESVQIELHFSAEMDCDQLTQSLMINSTTEDGRVAQLNTSSIYCHTFYDITDPVVYSGGIPTAWKFSAELMNVSNGVHTVTVNNATTWPGNVSTNSIDHFMFRIGQNDNPMIFPMTANYTQDLLFKANNNDTLWISHKAAGADQFRYSLNWGSSYSDWEAYSGGNTTLVPQAWSGTTLQEWTGDHVMVQYWSQMTGSSDHLQHADVMGSSMPPRRFPHLFIHGQFNQYGYDSGLPNTMEQDADGIWNYDFMTEWPTQFQINIWGMNPDGEPDVTGAFGDVDNDSIIDRIPPISLMENVVNITSDPPYPHLAYRISLNDGDYRMLLIPIGFRWQQILLYFFLAIIPVLSATLAIWTYLRVFYQVKFNRLGVNANKGILPIIQRTIHLDQWIPEKVSDPFKKLVSSSTMHTKELKSNVLMTMSSEVRNQPSPLPGFEDPDRRTVLIATMEYDIEDWAIKIKIGGLGVMAQLMGKNLGHQDLIWVVPCVGGIDYPEDRRTDPMVVTVLNTEYTIQVQYHTLRNITYVLLDAPVFRQQSKAEPYPPRMDDLDSAIYYSAWNSCIAQAMKRFPIDLYHINDYHGTIAPLHLLPETIPCCLSLHNAEFQGLWPMRTPQELSEVCAVYNLDQEVVQKYVQFGEVFNLLHAGASYLRVHQKGFGAVGVSKKYGKRSFARYPIFWGLTKIGSLPNPDPTDLEEWDKELSKADDDVVVDAEFESGRTELRRQAQEWAHLDQNPNAELFVFVGRWSMQKGIDLIADCFPAILEEHPNTQLICVGPVIDLYGKFAALKLEKMMSIYPGRVYSKPEFTALPPYIFSGAEFALIPSRDEPFGLVAVEFGRKGALGVGSRVGGLGQMPGWWFTIESTTTKHLVQQFKMAIQAALASKTDVRAMMRARSAKQRFPVAQWVEDLGILQSKAIKTHRTQALKSSSRVTLSRPQTPTLSRPQTPTSKSGASTPSRHWEASEIPSMPIFAPPSMLQNGSHSRAPSPPRLGPPPETETENEHENNWPLTLGVRTGPGHVTKEQRNRLSKRNPNSGSKGSISYIATPAAHPLPFADNPGDEDAVSNILDEYFLSPEQVEATVRSNQIASLQRELRPRGRTLEGAGLSLPMPPMPSPRTQNPASIPSTPGLSMPNTPKEHHRLISTSTPPTAFPFAFSDTNLSLETVLGGKKDFNLQNVEPFFTDPTGLYYDTFDKKLESLNGKSSEGDLCIEDYLAKSEKEWFNRFHNVKMGKSGATPASSIFRVRMDSPAGSIFNEHIDHDDGSATRDSMDEFLLRDNYVPPTGLKKMLRTKIGDWPIYAFLLAFGQIIAANSYQITLLTGEVGQAAEKLYIIATIYLVTSIVWWLVFRTFKSLYVVSVPFLFYGLAFLFLGLAPYCRNLQGKGWIQNVATGFYTVASSSGPFFFALNFGSEGTAPVATWSFRACVIQGTQQIYVVVLWFWGSRLTKLEDAGISNLVAYGPPLTGVTVPIALLMWAIGLMLFLGLPDYYRQSPGQVPSFYRSVFRRNIILWFFVAVIIQNYFLSAPYGRNWKYLWSSQHAPTWAVALLVLVFFIGVWAGLLWLFASLSTSHSWILPIFAVGLGAPRWCQMLWGTSNIGLFVPWAGSAVAGALVGRMLWLWLGVLDAIQGVGFGMILLQTLTRFHITFTLICAQVLGSITTILARATAPDRTGPGPIFPDFSSGYAQGLSQAWFWVCLLLQMSICVGFFMFFRKEQLSKP